MKPALQRGVTLVELLVVAAIVGILMALLLTGVRAALDNGKKVHCQSQLKQLFLAVKMYANDNGGIYPLIDNDNPTSASNGHMRYLGTYLENPKNTIFQCTNPSSSSPTDSYYYFNDLIKGKSMDIFSATGGDPVSSIDIFVCRSGWKNGSPVTFYPHKRGVNVLRGDGRVEYVVKGP